MGGLVPGRPHPKSRRCAFAVRMIPALIVNDEQVDQALDIWADVVADVTD
jgi:4-aminobutyrate aminotransferase-like enzyme